MHLVWYFRLLSLFCWGQDMFLRSHTNTFLPAVPTTSTSPTTLMLYTLSVWL